MWPVVRLVWSPPGRGAPWLPVTVVECECECECECWSPVLLLAQTKDKAQKTIAMLGRPVILPQWAKDLRGLVICFCLSANLVIWFPGLSWSKTFLQITILRRSLIDVFLPRFIS